MKDAPLREGFLLLGGLGLMAWPLASVTGEPASPAEAVVAIQSSDGQWFTDVELQAAHDFSYAELRIGDRVLGRVTGPAREGEFECQLPTHGGVVTVVASFPEGTPETALKVRLWPGSLPENVFTLWGEGELLEELELNFHE